MRAVFFAITVALAGIVVNNSLIFVEFANERGRRGMGLEESLVDAGRRRLRPILLTTITTVVGIAPLLAEQSFQARFLIPMGIAIAGGLTSATILTLVQLPAILMIVDDLKRLAGRAWGLAPRPAPTSAPCMAASKLVWAVSCWPVPRGASLSGSGSSRPRAAPSAWPPPAPSA